MPKLILIVDDSSSLRMVVRMALQRAGYGVLEAHDGLHALDELEKVGRVNLILSDVNMPRMDGITFVHKLKAHPRHRFTPVVMLTTEDQDAMIEKGRAAGAKAWLVKPFDPTQLLNAVARLVQA